jgi:transposase
MKESTANKVSQMQQRIKELEAMVGRKQIMIDYLEKMMDIAKDELHIDIKKNFATPQSSGSKKIEKK